MFERALHLQLPVIQNKGFTRHLYPSRARWRNGAATILLERDRGCRGQAAHLASSPVGCRAGPHYSKLLMEIVPILFQGMLFWSKGVLRAVLAIPATPSSEKCQECVKKKA